MNARGQKLTFTMAAGETRTFAAACTFVKGVSVPSGVTVRLLNFERQVLLYDVPLGTGNWVQIDQEAYWLEVYSASAQSITLFAIVGKYGDESVQFASGTILDVDQQPAGTFSEVTGTSVGAGACVLQAAADTTRLEMVIYNPDASATLFVRSNNTAAASALRLGPGERMSITATNAIYIYNSGSSAVVPFLTKTVTT